MSVFALLPAAAWLFVVALGGTEASEHIEAVRWALAETGTGVGRGFFLFVVLPGAVGIYSLVAAAARRDAAARIIVAGLGFLLAILNLASWAA